MKKRLFALLIFGVLIVISSCSKPTKTAKGYWESGTALFDIENYESAIDEYQNIIKYYPESDYAIKAAFSIAEINKNNLKNYEKAISCYKNIEKKYPDSEKTPNALFMIGYIYANELEKFEKAKEAYDYFIKNYPDNVLVSSAKWEIENLGKSLEELQEASLQE